MRYLALLLLVSIIATGCASHQAKAPTLTPSPLSILVLPPVNKTVEVDAGKTVLAHVSRPLADRGYYVFPVAIIERFMRENGMHSADQIHQIPLDRFQEHIAPDAILYMTITQWGQKFQVLQSVAVVDVNLLLVDARSGEPLWQRRAYKTYTPSSGNQNGLAGALLGAVVDQVIGSVVDHTDELAQDALGSAMDGLPAGLRLVEHSNLENQ